MECSLCLNDYHNKQFIHTTCCKQRFCVNCGLKMLKISDIGLPYFESCPFCRKKFSLCLNEITHWNKPQLLQLIETYSNRPPYVYFHQLRSTNIAHQYPNSAITNVNGEWTNMLGDIVESPPTNISQYSIDE